MRPFGNELKFIVSMMYDHTIKYTIQINASNPIEYDFDLFKHNYPTFEELYEQSFKEGFTKTKIDNCLTKMGMLQFIVSGNCHVWTTSTFDEEMETKDVDQLVDYIIDCDNKRLINGTFYTLDAYDDVYQIVLEELKMSDGVNG